MGLLHPLADLLVGLIPLLLLVRLLFLCLLKERIIPSSPLHNHHVIQTLRVQALAAVAEREAALGEEPLRVGGGGDEHDEWVSQLLYQQRVETAYLKLLIGHSELLFHQYILNFDMTADDRLISMSWESDVTS